MRIHPVKSRVFNGWPRTGNWCLPSKLFTFKLINVCSRVDILAALVIMVLNFILAGCGPIIIISLQFHQLVFEYGADHSLYIL